MGSLLFFSFADTSKNAHPQNTQSSSYILRAAAYIYMYIYILWHKLYSLSGFWTVKEVIWKRRKLLCFHGGAENYATSDNFTICISNIEDSLFLPTVFFLFTALSALCLFCKKNISLQLISWRIPKTLELETWHATRRYTGSFLPVCFEKSHTDHLNPSGLQTK